MPYYDYACVVSLSHDLQRSNTGLKTTLIRIIGIVVIGFRGQIDVIYLVLRDIAPSGRLVGQSEGYRPSRRVRFNESREGTRWNEPAGSDKG